MRVQGDLVLVVEDEVLVRISIVDALRSEGLEVIEFGCGADALEMVKGRPDVKAIFTDINMPGTVDGLKLVQIVHGSHPGIALFVASGKPAKSVLSQLPRGASFYPKPYDVGELVEAICAPTAQVVPA